MWIDSHCHLTHENIKGQGSPEEIVARAKAAGVDGMLNISCQIRGDFPDVLATAKKFENVWCSIGTHPHDAGLPEEKEISLEKLIELASSDEKIIGIGESGLDYYYNHSSKEDQQESFRKHIRACIETDLPLIVHARDADEDVIRIIKEEGAGTDLAGVMHCFSSGPKMAEEALEIGFYLSFSGIVTFKKATELQDIARRTPLERILVETDSPYLAPEPLRGKTNEPANVALTGKYLANLKNLNEESMATHSKKNFFNLFKKATLS